MKPRLLIITGTNATLDSINPDEKISKNATDPLINELNRLSKEGSCGIMLLDVKDSSEPLLDKIFETLTTLVW